MIHDTTYIFLKSLVDPSCWEKVLEYIREDIAEMDGIVVTGYARMFWTIGFDIDREPYFGDIPPPTEKYIWN